jgi:serine protease
MRNALFVIPLLSLAAFAWPTTASAQALPLHEDADAPTAFVEDVPDEIPGEIAVDVKDNATATDLADLAQSFAISLTPNSAWSDANDKIEVAFVSQADEASLLDKLSRDPRVEHAERMSVLRAYFVPNDPLYASKQWHLKRVGGESAWEYSCGKGVTVAIIDTGVACFDKGPFTKGTDLAGTRCEGGYNFVDNKPEASDDHGHGTHVAGTVAQTTHNGMGTAGLAFCSTLMPIKVLSRQGFGTVANVAEGIRFAADHGAQVINMSLGGPIRSKILEDAVNHAMGKGVLVVAAAGNSGRSVGYPAAYPGVVAVSATDSNDKIAWFSSRGPEIAIGAPGVSVTQQTICDGGRNKCELFGTFNGTSMASPHVAGAAAMIVGQGVTEPGAVLAALEKSAVPKDDPKLYGAGILDVGASAARTHWLHFVLRAAALLALAIAVGRRIKRGAGTVARTPGALFGALFAAVGLLPIAPLLHLASRAGSLRWLVDLLAHPFGEWDLLLAGANLHRWLPLASALPALALTALFFGSKKLRPLVGGFALGSAALMTQMAISADVLFVMGSLALRVWMALNVVACLWLARMALDKK